MADDDEWDTSGNTEGAADPYNKSSFAGSAAAPSDEMANLKVGGEQEAAAPEPAPPAVGEAAPAADTEEQQETQPSPAAPPAEPPAPAAAPDAPEEAMTASAVEQAAAAPEPPRTPEPPAAPAPPRTPSPSSATRHAPGSVPRDAPDFLKETHEAGTAFTEKLDPDALKFFNELCEKPFSEQGVAFLNAYWEEVNSQAEFIFTVGWEMIKYADMHAKGVQYIHLYKEGNDLDFNIGLYFYEKLCKKVLDDDEGIPWRENPQFAPSIPEMMTAIKRKIELREKVDCNFDGRVSFLEYLLYQYRDFANPADFTFRAMKTDHLEEHPEIVKARKALEEVNLAIQAYEAEKHRLETEAEKPGVKGLGAKHQLAILDASPLAEQLNKSLITAEAAVRMASRKFGNGKVAVTTEGGESPVHRKPTEGSVWWMNRDLAEKQKRYGKQKK